MSLSSIDFQIQHSNLFLFNPNQTKLRYILILLFIYKTREMLTGAPGALVKDTKKGNYIVIIALKTV